MGNIEFYCGYWELRDGATALSTIDFVLGGVCLVEFFYCNPGGGTTHAVDVTWPVVTVYILILGAAAFAFFAGIVIGITVLRGNVELLNASVFAQVVFDMFFLSLLVYYAFLSIFWLFGLGLLFWFIVVYMTFSLNAWRSDMVPVPQLVF